MTDNKSLGQIAFEGSGLGDHIGTPYKTLLPFSKCNWEAAAQAVRRAVIDECIQAVGSAAWKHEGNDAYSKGMDQGARHQVDACIEALRSLKRSDKTESDNV